MKKYVNGEVVYHLIDYGGITRERRERVPPLDLESPMDLPRNAQGMSMFSKSAHSLCRK